MLNEEYNNMDDTSIIHEFLEGEEVEDFDDESTKIDFKQLEKTLNLGSNQKKLQYYKTLIKKQSNGASRHASGKNQTMKREHSNNIRSNNLLAMVDKHSKNRNLSKAPHHGTVKISQPPANTEMSDHKKPKRFEMRTCHHPQQQNNASSKRLKVKDSITAATYQIFNKENVNFINRTTLSNEAAFMSSKFGSGDPTTSLN